MCYRPRVCPYLNDVVWCAEMGITFSLSVTALTHARAVSNDIAELARSNAALVEMLATEVDLHDPALAAGLAVPLKTLAVADS